MATFFAIRILGLRESIDKLVKMGCKMSKQLKSKNAPRFRGAKASRRHSLHPEVAVEHQESHPDVHAHSEAIEHISSSGSSVEPQTDHSSIKVEITSDVLTPDHAMSTRTTDSGDSPSKLETPTKPKSPEAIFDDEVLLALAEADADTRLREELAYRAIIRSMSM